MFLLLLLLLCAAASTTSAWTPMPASCKVTAVGCIQDGPSRSLPFCTGTPDSGPHADCGLTCAKPDGLAHPPDDPPCDSSKLTPTYCARLCYAYLSSATEYKGLIYSGTQMGGQCWCGLKGPFTQLPAASCSQPCQGDPSIMCGGPYISSAMQVDCRTGSGWPFVAVLLGAAAVYLGIGGGFQYSQGARGLPNLLPHRAFWLEVRALVADGVAFSRGRRRLQGKSTAGGSMSSSGGDGSGGSALGEALLTHQPPHSSKQRKQSSRKAAGKRHSGSKHSNKTEKNSAEIVGATSSSDSERQRMNEGSAAAAGGRWVRIPTS
eukprot:COSAG01_NODE_5769_length_4045_cov_3.262038_3_plen_320_part_00